ncbi:MAG: hypothetical protein KME46_33585 [Brasilonema angustatum HA4187-MV1]|jgi:hypothetical protein|nr:hypothetical protein [Brasilonema angustatum HA4187-MV1]
MYALNRLSPNKKYLISNHPGQWHFSRVAGDYANFYRFAYNNKRLTIRLSLTQVQLMVWEQVQINLSNLEAFKGE